MPVLPQPSAAGIVEALERIDLTSADGRAGIRCLLAELERLDPGNLQRQSVASGPRPS